MSAAERRNGRSLYARRVAFTAASSCRARSGVDATENRFGAFVDPGPCADGDALLGAEAGAAAGAGDGAGLVHVVTPDTAGMGDGGQTGGRGPLSAPAAGTISAAASKTEAASGVSVVCRSTSPP